MPSIPQYEQKTAPNGQMLTPNARGIQVDDSIGRGLQQVGHAGMQFADTMRTMKDRQDADDAQAWIAKTMADARMQWTQHALESRETAQPGGAGYTPGLLKDFDDYANKTLESAPSPKAKEQLAQHLYTFKSQLGQDAISWEAGQRRAYRMDTIGQGIGAAANVIERDPRQYADALAEQLQAIDNLQMQPEDKAKLREQARSQLATASMLGQIQRDPRAALRDLQGATPVEAGTPSDAVANAARAQGVDPQTALAFVQLESAGNPSAVNKRSGAFGLFQFLRSTGAQYGVQEGASVEQQAEAGARFMKDTQAQLQRSIGHQPQPWELYMGHVFGGAGGPAILNAPDDMPVEAALAKVSPGLAGEMAAGNGLAGMTVGQVKQKFQAITARAMDRVAGVAHASAIDAGEQSTKPASTDNAAVSALTLQERLRLRSAAETEVNRQQATARAQLDDVVRDASAAYSSGQVYPNPPGLDNFVEAYGPQEGSQRYGEFRRTQQLGEDIGQVKNLSFAEQNDMLRRRAPVAGEGFAGDARRFETLAQAVGASRKAFEDDPAQYAATNSPGVNTAYKQLVDAMKQPPTSQGGQDALKFLTQQYVTATKAEQQRIAAGTPGFTPKIVPDSLADTYVQQFNQQAQGGQNAANFVMQLADQWGPAWPELYGQMAKKMPPTALVIGAGMAQAPASLLAEAGKMKREELLDGLPSSTGKDLKDALTSEFADFGKTLANQVGGTQTYGTFFGETEKLALMYARQGEAPAKAAQHAFADTVGDKYSFENTYRVPKTQDVPAVNRGAGLALENLDPVNLRIPTSSGGLTPDQTREAYTNAVRRNGYWVTAPDESGLVLYANGAAVPDATGRPIVHTWDELQRLSSASPTFLQRLLGSKPAAPPEGGASFRATP